ncbi:regulator of chromosome condensation 1/beta-lactamase-inhibitor protein II [Chytriomyces sp. MP71]|nr:regulator of chromosome condensation 1/beta-lactamase-inhibitor protein II [Chytriomyces sp. MP71]
MHEVRVLGFIATDASTLRTKASFQVPHKSVLMLSWNCARVLPVEASEASTDFDPVSDAALLPDTLGNRIAFILYNSALCTAVVSSPTQDACLRPTRLVDASIVSMAASRYNLCAVDKDSRLLQWELSNFDSWSISNPAPSSSEISLPQPIASLTKIAAGYSHFLGLSLRGQVVSWGRGLHGQLGIGMSSNAEHGPALVEALDGLIATDIACGGNHSVVVVDGIIVYTFGSNSRGQLGRSRKVDFATPAPLSYNFDSETKDALKVQCGDKHTIAYRRDAVWGWGDNEWGAIGSQGGSVVRRPTLIPRVQKITTVICGAWSTGIMTKIET